jgi:hypothetical protein
MMPGRDIRPGFFRGALPDRVPLKKKKNKILTF